MSGNDKTPDVAEVAAYLGMKPGEVLEVVLDTDGVLAKTHDGNWTLIANDGSLQFRGKDPRPPAADETPEAAEKPAPKGRSRA